LSKKKFLNKVVGKDGLEIMMKIKEALDPNVIMNPGKVFSISSKSEKLRGDKERFRKFILEEWI